MREKYILAAILTVVGVAERLDDTTMGVDSTNVASCKLFSFMACGMNYTHADLVQPTLTLFAGSNYLNIVFPSDGSVPALSSFSLHLASNIERVI